MLNLKFNEAVIENVSRRNLLKGIVASGGLVIAAQFLRYPNAKVTAFDKGRSLLALAYGVVGRHYDLGGERRVGDGLIAARNEGAHPLELLGTGHRGLGPRGAQQVEQYVCTPEHDDGERCAQRDGAGEGDPCAIRGGDNGRVGRPWSTDISAAGFDRGIARCADGYA